MSDTANGAFVNGKENILNIVFGPIRALSSPARSQPKLLHFFTFVQLLLRCVGVVGCKVIGA